MAIGTDSLELSEAQAQLQGQGALLLETLRCLALSPGDEKAKTSQT